MKYIAKQIPFDKQESNFDYSCYEDCIIYGNNEFISYTNDIFDHMVKVFENGYLHEDIDNIPVNSSFSEYRKVIEDYFPIVYHDYKQYRTEDYTDNEIDIIRYAVDQYDYFGMYNQRDLISQVLSVLTEKQYNYKEIHGTTQGEWNVIYYPVNDYTDDQINIIEMEYYNTGYEFIIDTEDGFNISVYVHSYDDDDIKIELSDCVGCKPEEIELHHFTGYATIPIYD